MTTHYVDLTVVPDAETGVPPLLGALYDRLHRTLVQQRVDSVGVSFPQYSVIPRNLGDTLRLHGVEADLRQLMAADWLRGIRDHVRIAGIARVPDDAPHRVVSRKQFKSNVERLRRRRMKRKGETAEQAARAIPDTAAEKPHLPYVHLRSQSTGQPFCLFIAMGPLQAAPRPGSFNAYGLGAGSTIPWF
jgi:CRISPR-associated endonuclease Csy4